MEKLIYTWEQQIEDTNLICEKIAEDNFKPDVIVLGHADMISQDVLQSLKKDLEELTNLGLKRSAAASYLSNKNRIPKNIIYNLE